jgi:hypothetical protein
VNFDVAFVAVTSPGRSGSYLAVRSSVKSWDILRSIQTVCAQCADVLNNLCGQVWKFLSEITTAFVQ